MYSSSLIQFYPLLNEKLLVRRFSSKEGEEHSTKKVVLEAISRLESIDCPDCKGIGCSNCKDGAVPHPAAIRAKACLEARQAATKIGVIRKLIKAGRFHVSTNVIGALSGRMSGRDGLNATGIDHSKEFRACFTLAFRRNGSVRVVTSCLMKWPLLMHVIMIRN
jgi:hypothetical protein